MKNQCGRVLIVHLSFILTFLAVLYFVLPVFSLHIPFIYTSGFEWMVISFTCISSPLIFSITRSFNKKILTEKKHTAEILHRYEALSTASNDAIWDYNLITGHIYYNERVYSVFGYNREDSSNNTAWWSDNLHPEDKQRVENRIAAILKKGSQNWEDEYRFRCKDGSYKIVYDRSCIVFDENKKPIRLIGAMKDITELRNTERRLQEMQLERKNKAGRDIIKSQEAERKRIKDELQEDVNQILASIKLNINRLEENECSDLESYNASISFLNEAIAKVRTLSKTLNSATFDYFGLVAAIGELAITADTDFAIKIQLEAEQFDENLTDPSLQLLLFRIIQEQIASLSNKYVTEVSINLSNSNNIIQLSMTDNRKLTENQNEENKTENESFSELRSKLEMYKGNLYITPASFAGRELKVVI